MTLQPQKISYDAAESDKSILTQFAAPETDILSSRDGWVGNILPNDILVTSPNTHVLYLPPLGKILISLKRDNHYGVYDPLYYPQPFAEYVGHLCLILRPNMVPDDPYYYCWVQPTAAHFIAEDTTSLLGRLGCLDDVFYAGLEAVFLRVLKKVTGDRISEDRFVLEASSQLQTVLACLKLPASRSDLFIRVAWAQRMALELHARIRWIGKEWTQRRKDAKLRARIHEAVDVMGAFTEDLETLDFLFHAGIPVWWVRLANNSPNARIDEVVPFIREDNQHRFHLRSNTVIDCMDESPPHPVIFSGACAKPERYIRMGGYLRSRLQYPLLLGSDEPRSSLSLRNAVTSVSEGPHGSKSERFVPYARPERRKVPSEKGGKNPFMEFSHPLMPPGVDHWILALKYLAGYHSARPEDGGHYNFWLPPARCLLSPENDQKKGLLFVGWLRIRDLILFLLSNPGCSPLQLSNKQWRTLLNVCARSDLSQDDGTKGAARRKEVREQLEKGLEKSNVFLRVENLFTKTVSWKGTVITGLPSAEITREILWELCELNFRNELMALDRFVDNSGMTPLQRQDMLDRCWCGTVGYVDLAMLGQGLGSQSWDDRVPHIKALHAVMCTWRGSKPQVLSEPFPVDNRIHNFRTFVDCIHRELANFFVDTFLKSFGRAASIPYSL